MAYSRYGGLYRKLTRCTFVICINSILQTRKMINEIIIVSFITRNVYVNELWSDRFRIIQLETNKNHFAPLISILKLSVIKDDINCLQRV